MSVKRILDNLYEAGDDLINPPQLEELTEEDLNNFLNYYMTENYRKDVDEAIEEYNKKGFIPTNQEVQ